MAPYRALPVEIQVAEIIGSLDERRSFADNRIGDTHIVRRCAESGLLFHITPTHVVMTKEPVIWEIQGGVLDISG